MTGANLAQMIERMYSAKLIREHVRDAADEVRFSGNEVAHGDLVDEPIPQEDAAEILGLMDEILEEVFESPGRVAERKKKRLARDTPQP